MSESIAIVTGGTRGLGFAAAEALGVRGYHVVCTYRSDAENAEGALARLWKQGISGEILRLDAGAADAATVVGSLERLRTAKSVVALHNAAASFVPKPIHLVGWEEYEAQLSAGLRGLVSLMRACLPRMVQAGGGVLGVVLTRAVMGPPPKGFAPYVAAKHAMHSLVRSLAVEQGARGVRTLAFCPTYMESMLTHGWNPSVREAVRSHGTTDVAVAGGEIARLVAAASNGQLPGLGEEYVL